jgi:formate dehydrogenase gamma subunit
VYLALIIGTIGFMLAHNVLVFAKKIRARYRIADLTVLRMDFSQRMQHFVLASSFIVLAITGFALKFPDSWVARLLGSNEGFRRWSHRGAGVVLLLVGAYHIFYVLTKKEGRQLVKDLLPVRKDVRDLTDNARYLTGLSSQKAKIGRFGYAEKMEYWAVIWGTIIMGVTGLMIWFKMDVTQLVPRWAVDVALTIHYYEAILACLAIVVWHFYHVIFDPDVYPLNWACWKGKVSRHWQEEEHPLERLGPAENRQTVPLKKNTARDQEKSTVHP